MHGTGGNFFLLLRLQPPRMLKEGKRRGWVFSFPFGTQDRLALFSSGFPPKNWSLWSRRIFCGSFFGWGNHLMLAVAFFTFTFATFVFTFSRILGGGGRGEEREIETMRLGISFLLCAGKGWIFEISSQKNGGNQVMDAIPPPRGHRWPFPVQ